MEKKQLLYNIVASSLSKNKFTNDDFPNYKISNDTNELYVNEAEFDYLRNSEKVFNFFGIDVSVVFNKKTKVLTLRFPEKIIFVIGI